MRRITLSPRDFCEGLVPTYENIAKKTEYPVTENTTYDCRKADIAANIQEAWISFYHDRTKKAHPELDELTIQSNIMALLLNCGAKVDSKLSDNEVIVKPGFASETS